MVELGIGRIYIGVAGLPHAHAEIYVVEGDLEADFVEPANLFEHGLPYDQTRGCHGRAVADDRSLAEIAES
jgi:hypothetical protein